MEQMRAVVLPRASAPLAIEEIPVPAPRAGEVLVRVAACGVCHTDLHVIKGEVAFPTPAVLGHEISGTVVALGPGTRGVREGSRVVSSFIMPCGTCVFCAQGRDDLCETFFALNRLKDTSTTAPVACAPPTARRWRCTAWVGWRSSRSCRKQTCSRSRRRSPRRPRASWGARS